MINKKAYKHYQYDVTILQSRTMTNIIRALNKGLENNNVSSVVNHLIKIRRKAMATGVGRKANSRLNTVDKKIVRLKQLGYKISEEE